MANFLLKAPDALFTSCTQAQALQVCIQQRHMRLLAFHATAFGFDLHLQRCFGCVWL
jgi:hypothetical protein